MVMSRTSTAWANKDPTFYCMKQWPHLVLGSFWARKMFMVEHQMYVMLGATNWQSAKHQLRVQIISG